MNKKGVDSLTIVKKPEMHVGEKWCFKTFILDPEGVPLHGTTTSEIIDRGMISVGSNEYEVYRVHVAQEVSGEHVVKDRLLKILRTITQSSYIRCSDLRMVADVVHEDVTTTIGEKKNINTRFRAILHDPPLTPFDYPLKVGKKWKVSATPKGVVGDVGLLKQIRRSDFPETIVEFECIKTEDVIVPAGKYPCMVIRVKAKHPQKSRFLAGDEYLDYYSPKAKDLVKSEERSNGKLTARHILTSYVSSRKG